MTTKVYGIYVYTNDSGHIDEAFGELHANKLFSTKEKAEEAIVKFSLATGILIADPYKDEQIPDDGQWCNVQTLYLE